ncbi:MAG TPA: DUF2336 domain-containing protein [Xanthobacteraceae bacterium]|nr:DUF2336 domain-containing protein [Xanthobacteraceae bacterium]
MIVRQFLQWQRTATAADRADATSALARAYLYSDLTPDDRAAAEGALLMLLDDPSPLVRMALAQALADSEWAPPNIIVALLADQPEIAACVLAHSPLLLDADLVDAAATLGARAQIAIASRRNLPAAVSAAIAEVGSAEACLVLVENAGADIAPFSLDRIVERFGHLGAIREAMLAREDLPAQTRQGLVAKLAETLAGFVTARAWLEEERAQRLAKDACEKATVILAAAAPGREIIPLVRHLRESGQLNAGLILRALLSGNIELFVAALADLAEMPPMRVSALVHDPRGTAFRALYRKAGLPDSAYPAFSEAVEALREGGLVGSTRGAVSLKRRMVERVITRCADEPVGDVEPLLTLLRRFAAEAAREEARLFCDDLISGAAVSPPYEPDRAAA